MRSSLASIITALTALAALGGPATAQYCSQLVPAIAGQVVTDDFGTTVELGDTWAHISDVALASSGVPGAGGLSLYSRAPVLGSASGGHLLFEGQVSASNGQPGDGFGLSSDRSQGTVVVGAPFHDGAGVNSGAVYLFEVLGGQWTQILEVAAPAGAGDFDEFGKHVAIDGDWMAIAAPGRNRVYVYRRTNGVWSLGQTLGPSNFNRMGMTGLKFNGGSLAICGRRVFGLFELNAATQTWGLTLSAATSASFAFTGMDFSGDRIVIARNNGLMDVYTLNPQAGSWVPSIFAQLSASSVAIVGERILVATDLGPSGLVNLFSPVGSSSWALEDSIPGALNHPDSLATDGESVFVARLVDGLMDGPTLYDLDCGSIGVSDCIQFEVNSTGFAGKIEAVGSDLVAGNDVTLRASVLPQDAFGFFIVSQTPASVFSMGPLCLGGSIGRYVGPGQIQNTGAAGTLSLSVDLTAIPSPSGFVAAAPGDTWYFQCWHRDVAPAGTSSFTDAVRVDLR